MRAGCLKPLVDRREESQQRFVFFWYDHRDARVNRSKEHTSAMLDTSSNGYNLLTEEDMDIFIRKIDAVNGHRDSLYSKSKQQEEDIEVAKKRLPVCFKCAPTPEQQVRDEEKRYIAHHRRVVKDILLHLSTARLSALVALCHSQVTIRPLQISPTLSLNSPRST
jgi:hypothetical protein